jgi:hypothetical protein
VIRCLNSFAFKISTRLFKVRATFAVTPLLLFSISPKGHIRGQQKITVCLTKNYRRLLAMNVVALGALPQYASIAIAAKRTMATKAVERTCIMVQANAHLGGRDYVSKSRADMNALIVEDEFFITTWLQSMLGEMGFRRIVHETSVPKALHAIDATLPDLCFLDLSLNGAMSYPMASVLKASKVPFAFLTGFGQRT